MSAPIGAREWKARPGVGWLIRIVVFVTPIALSILVTSAMTKIVERPRGVTGNIAWWVFMSLVGASVLYATELVMRRLLPLATLLKLTLVFPDHAPARFRVALRTGTPKQLARKLQDANSQSLGSTPQQAAEKLLELVAALSVHDRLTRGHCERVRAYTDVITKDLGLDAEDAARMHWAAMIHDIGKLDVPAEILNKPTRLTDEEYEIIKTHPQAGARIAAPLAGWLGEWFHAVDQHHERWDGKGYPYGLAGTDISIAGRIAAVADVYDVITAARSYKKPQPAAQARTELARCAGTQFDPEIVRAFLGVSLGRLRLMMGPLAWLTDLPVIGRVPIAPAAGAAVSAVAAAGTLMFGGLLHTATAEPAVYASPAATVVHAAAAAPGPVAVDANETVRAGHAGEIDLQAKGGWPEGSVVRIVEAPSVGTAELDPSGKIRYIAPTNFEGPVVITYEVCNETGCTRGHVTIHVVNGLRATDDEVATKEDTALVISALGNDLGGGSALSLAEVSTPAHGRVTMSQASIAYEPLGDFNGVDTFTYIIADDSGNTSIGKITVHVASVNDTPTFTVGTVQSRRREQRNANRPSMDHRHQRGTRGRECTDHHVRRERRRPGTVRHRARRRTRRHPHLHPRH